MPGVGAIILAAGGSSRMGRPKQLLRIGDESLLCRAARAVVDAGCRLSVVVLGANHQQMMPELAGLPVEIALNADWQRGIGSSIRCGVERLIELNPQLDAAVIALCDQPMITQQIFERLILGFTPSSRPIRVSSFADTIGPPVLVGTKFFPDLLALPDDQGAKSIWMNREEFVERIPCEAAAVDIDTPEDFRNLTR